MSSEQNVEKYSPEEYTSLEETRIKEFRAKVSDLNLTSEWLEDAHLIRWLRARDLDIEKAYTMIKTSLQWRKDNNVDGIEEREEIPDEFKRKTPFALCGLDNGGYPVLLIPFGSQDMREFLQKYGREKLYRFHLVNFERMMKMLREESQRQGRPVTQFVELMDCEGYNFRQMLSKQCLDFMGEIQAVMDNHYPEILRHAMIVNAPKIFHVFFNIVKPIIPKNTLEKMYIYGTDKESWQKVVVEKFDLEQIPPRWGGTRAGSDEFCSKDEEIWLNGPVPLSHFNQNEADPTLTLLTLDAGDTFETKFKITQPDCLIGWKFRSEEHDIGFKILFEGEVVVPLTRVPSSMEYQESTHACDKLGVYTFVFDNSYSMVRAKKVFYNVYLIEPIEVNQAN